MAIANTTLSANLNATDTLWPITSTTGITAGMLIKVDSEIAVVASVPGTTSAIVRCRGSEGTTATTHNSLTNVIAGLSSDWPAIPPGQLSTATQPSNQDDVVTFSVNGAIPVPTRNTTILLAKATALTGTTLAAPSTTLNGMRVTITSQTAAAHVITATALLENGLTGSPWTTATFPAFIGSSMVLVAQNGLWQVVGLSSGPVVLT